MHMDVQRDTDGQPDRALLGEFLKRVMSTTDARSVANLADRAGVSRPTVTKIRDGHRVEFASLERVSHLGLGWDPDALTEASLGHVDRLLELGVPDHLVTWLRNYLTRPTHPGASRNSGVM